MTSLDPQQVSIVAILFAIGAAGLKKMWVFGWTYSDKVKDLADMTKDRDFWRDTALASLVHVDKALDKKA